MSKDASIGWMYEGAKGSVHREDYLLGKKVDKNFEKYSDVVNTQKAETIDAIVGTRTVYGAGESSSGLKTSSLQKDIIKSEDPFVAVKVREETKRRELMDNPLMKARLQNMLKTMMTSKNEKKKDKKEKKSKKDKKKKKRSRSSSASSRDSSEERRVKRRRSPSPKRKKRRDSSPERSSRRDRSPRRQRSDSREERSSRRREERSRRFPRREDREHCKRSKSRSKSPEPSRKFDSHIPDHLQKRRHSSPSESESEDDRRRRHSDDEREDPRKKAYGLVEMRKRTAEEREEDARAPTKELKLVKFPTGRGGNDRRNEPRKKLTDEEKAARLAEMQENVKWRDEVRSKNVERHRVEDKEEKEEADKNGYAPSFIRSQMRDACDDMTVEKRLQSRKGGVQKAHGYMDKSFARK